MNDLDGVVLRASNLRFSRSTPSSRFELVLHRMTLRRGAQCALVGPSGCGKTTLLDILALALQPRTGESFTLHARPGEPDCTIDLLAAWRHSPDLVAGLRGANFGYVLQQGGLLPFMSVRQNVLLPARLSGCVDDTYCDALLDRLGVAALQHKRPTQLSLGERQRVGIARALIHRPAVIFADEPTASVDPANGERIAQLFLELVEEAGAALVVATHDQRLVERLDLAPFALEMTVRDDGVVSEFAQ